MGDISVIARRLSGRYVQHGWSGNGGYFKAVGARLLEWYDTPEMVEYLFGLGQLKHLWEPHSEEYMGSEICTVPDGMPHWVSPSEHSIFSKIAFIDYGYFYDADHTWYYVHPGPFRIKLPLALVEENLDDRSFEFSFLRQVEHLVLDEMFSGRYAQCLATSGLSPDELQKIQGTLAQDEHPLYQLWDRYRSVFQCFDDWILVRADGSGKNIGDIILQARGDSHRETIFWNRP